MKNKNIISICVACTESGVIGKDNNIPWKLPEDMKNFKAVTTGKTVVMGRKTFESIGKPLPNRLNIIVTRDEKYIESLTKKGIKVDATKFFAVTSLEKAFSHPAIPAESEIVAIGGARIYEETLPIADLIYLTKIHGDCDGDTYFPELNLSEWKVLNAKTATDESSYFKDDSNFTPLSFTMETLAFSPKKNKLFPAIFL